MLRRQLIESLIDPTRGREGGFTIIEVILAISLLAIGLLAIANMQITAIRGNSSARRTSERVTWAQDKFEELMTLAYSHADLAESGNTHVEASPPAGYTVEWDVTDNTPVPNTKLITVTVAGLGKTIQLTGVKPNF